jgi:hypothetical protein
MFLQWPSRLRRLCLMLVRKVADTRDHAISSHTKLVAPKRAVYPWNSKPPEVDGGDQGGGGPEHSECSLLFIRSLANAHTHAHSHQPCLEPLSPGQLPSSPRLSRPPLSLLTTWSPSDANLPLLKPRVVALVRMGC